MHGISCSFVGHRPPVLILIHEIFPLSCISFTASGSCMTFLAGAHSSDGRDDRPRPYPGRLKFQQYEACD